MAQTKVWSLMMVLVVALTAACAEDAEPPEVDAPTEVEEPETPETPEAPEEPEEATEPDSVTLTLNWLAGGPQAGFTYAKELGFYDEENLDVTIQEGQGSVTTAQLVATGGTEIGFADGMAAMQLRGQGAPVTIVSPILQTNAYATISLAETGIESIEDLRGKRVGVQPDGSPGLMLPAILQAHGLTEDDIDRVDSDPAALVPALLQGEVDAILGGADAQAVSIRAEGFETNEQFHADSGAPTIGLSIIVNDGMIDEAPDVIARFVRASIRGWHAARDNPQAAAQSIADAFPASATDLNQIVEQLMVDLSVLCAEGADVIGDAPLEVWESSLEIGIDYMGMDPDLPLEEYYTTEFIPSDAPAC